MKPLYRLNTFIFRTALLFGAMLSMGQQTQAQTTQVTTTPVNYNVTHRVSYLYDRNQGYDAPGYATELKDYWDSEKGEQIVNEFKITHYVKRNDTPLIIELPTTYFGGNASASNAWRNQHTQFQRFYNYDNETDVASVLNRITTANATSGNVALVRFYQYNNGLVTGRGIYWGNNTGGDNNHNVIHNLYYTNTDGTPLTLAVDASLYTDYTYQNTNRLQGDLEEPSLNMRYILYA